MKTLSSFILAALILFSLNSCQKELSSPGQAAKQPAADVVKAPYFDLSTMIMFTPSERREGVAERSPYAIKNVNWFLKNDFCDFAAGTWKSGTNSQYGWWQQPREQIDYFDSTTIILHHVYPAHPELNGAVAIQLFAYDWTDGNGNPIPHDPTVQTGTWELIGVASNGIYSRYTRGSGTYTYTFAEQTPTGWYLDGTPINPTKRTVTITGRIRY